MDAVMSRDAGRYFAARAELQMIELASILIRACGLSYKRARGIALNASSAQHRPRPLLGRAR